MKGFPSEPFRGGMEHSSLAIIGQRRQRQRFAARRTVWIVVAADAEIVFGLFIEGFEIVVGDGPVGEICSRNGTHDRAQAKGVGPKGPGKSAEVNRTATNHGWKRPGKS